MAVILVRHGRVDYNTMGLNDMGKSFAEELKRRYAMNSIGKIVSMAAQRCVDTVTPLAQSGGTMVETVSGAHGIIAAIDESDWSTSDLVCVFQYAALGDVFAALGITPPAARDDAYGMVWIYDKGNRTVSTFDTNLR